MINLVSNDGLPSMAITLKNANTGEPDDPDTWDAINVSDPTAIVYMKFRKQGETVIIDTMACVNETDGEDGKVILIWSATALAGLEAGLYEGELYIDFNGTIQTVYDQVLFNIRDDF